MISAGLEGRLAYMTYPEPWRGPPKQHPEFLRPAPKPVTSRYNGVSNTCPNGTRLAPSQQRSHTKYPSPPTVPAPVNLTQHKDEVTDELPYSPYRLYTPAHFTHFSPFTTMYQTPYSHMMRPTFPTTPLPPLETYSPTTPTSITVSSTFLSPPSTYSPPAAIKAGQSILRDKRTPPQPPPPPPPPPLQPPSSQIQQQQQQQQQQHLNQTQVAFKVPSGKEGSLKHRILTRPEDNSSRCLTNSSNNNVPLDLQKTPEAVRKRLNAATMSPPRSPKKSHNNNNTVLGNFTKGMLIKLASGELRRIEDMRTEDFVNSAERCQELRLADSTVVKIEENHTIGTATVTLSYNQRRTQVEVEAAIEHPFFVFGQGWASCNPDRTQQLCKLKVHRLQVGDIVVSLTPREQFANLSLTSCSSPSSSSITLSSSLSGGAIQQLPRPPTIVTTATSTSMTSRQISVNPPIQSNQIVNNNNDNNNNNNNRDDNNHQPINLQTTHHHSASSSSSSPDSLAARKRRWSAPEICDDDNNDTTTIRRRID